MNTLWTCGCSHTAKYVYYRMNFLVNDNPFKKYEQWKGGKLPPVWPAFLAKKLNLNLKNLGLGGNCNYSIFDQFINVCDQIKQDDLLIIQWTTFSRFRAANFDTSGFSEILVRADIPEGTCLEKSTVDEIFYNRSHPVWMTEVLNWMKLINMLIDKIGAQVFYWTADADLTKIIYEKQTLGYERFITYPHNTKTKYDTLMSHISNIEPRAFIFQETNCEIDDYHFGEHGHRALSDHIYDYLVGRRGV